MRTRAGGIAIWALPGIPEVQPGQDLVRLILDAASLDGEPLEPGDVLVVTHKVVGKAEGRVVDLAGVTPSPFAVRYGERNGKDPRQVEVVLRESVRIVRMEGRVLICETRHGFVCANAGVDASNVPGSDTVCLLPLDPDASARKIREGVRAALGFDLAVVITDTFGRPWRNGLTNVAIGVSGLKPLDDLRGLPDAHGREMKATVTAVADELAAASELAMGKVAGRPVAVIRGFEHELSEGAASELVMAREMDLFR